MKPRLQSGDRLLTLATNNINAAPAKNTEPHFVQQPTIEGLPTRGYGLALVTPESGTTLVVGGAGLTLTVYRLIPTLGVYVAGTPITGVGMDKQYVNYDFGGAQGYYIVVTPATVTADGNILFCFVELP